MSKQVRPKAHNLLHVNICHGNNGASICFGHIRFVNAFLGSCYCQFYHRIVLLHPPLFSKYRIFTLFGRNVDYGFVLDYTRSATFLSSPWDSVSPYTGMGPDFIYVLRIKIMKIQTSIQNQQMLFNRYYSSLQLLYG